MEAVDRLHVDFFRLTPVVEESELDIELNLSVAEDCKDDCRGLFRRQTGR